MSLKLAMKQINWIKLVTWLVGANQNALFRKSVDSTFGSGSDCSAKWATTTARYFIVYFLLNLHYVGSLLSCGCANYALRRKKFCRIDPTVGLFNHSNVINYFVFMTSFKHFIFRSSGALLLPIT